MATSPPRPSGSTVHATAVVEDGALVGDGTRVWHFAHVRAGARVGAGCNLGKDVYIDEGAVIGDRVKIQNGVSVYKGVTIGNDVFVGPAVTFTNDLRPRAHKAEWALTPTVVEAGASIGANATILAGVTLGENCMVGAGSVVTRSIRAHELVVGNPARRAGWVCRCGRVLSHSSEPPDPIFCPDCLAQ